MVIVFMTGKPLPAKLRNRGTGDWGMHYPYTSKKFFKKNKKIPHK
jgi:hypothetical protein